MSIVEAQPLPVRTPAKSHRMLQLDVLRGVAILLVLCRHPMVSPDAAGGARIPATAIYHLGWTGVDLFFVLSGFLVGGLLMKELRARGRLDIKRFIIRRGLKIWPAYYVMILCALGITAWRHGPGTAARLYWPNLLHLQNYISLGPEFAGQTWSLAVEEHFYLALPLLLWLLVRRRAGDTAGLRFLPAISGAAVVACFVARCVIMSHRSHFGYRTMHFPTHMRIDALGTGVLLAYLYHFHPRLYESIGRRRWLLIALGVAMISPMAVLELETSRFVSTFGYTLLALGYAAILVALVQTPVGPAGGILGRLLASPASRLIGAIGVVSYSIYLWMFFVSEFIQWALKGDSLNSLNPSTQWLVTMGLWIGGAWLAGEVSAKVMELPVLRLRDRLFPARSDALRQGAA